MTSRMQWDDDWVEHWQEWAEARRTRLDIYRATRVLAAWRNR